MSPKRQSSLLPDLLGMTLRTLKGQNLPLVPNSQDDLVAHSCSELGTPGGGEEEGRASSQEDAHHSTVATCCSPPQRRVASARLISEGCAAKKCPAPPPPLGR